MSRRSVALLAEFCGCHARDVQTPQSPKRLARVARLLPRPSRRSWRPDPAATHLSAFSEVMGPPLVHPFCGFSEATPPDRAASVQGSAPREPAVISQQPPVVGSTQFGGSQQSRPRSRRDCRNRGIAVMPSRDAARSHSRGRSRGDGEGRTGPLARYRLAPRRREITFGRQSRRPSRAAGYDERDRQVDLRAREWISCNAITGPGRRR
jgi:hypothetical protein